MLAAVVADPALPVDAIEILAPEERTEILLRWNDTAHPVAAATLLDAFALRVATRAGGDCLDLRGQFADLC